MGKNLHNWEIMELTHFLYPVNVYKKRFAEKRRNMKKWLAVLIAVVICIAFAPVFLLYTWPDTGSAFLLYDSTDQTQGWQAYTNEAGTIKPLTFLDGQYGDLDYEGQTLYHSRVLTEELPEAILELQPVAQSVSIFLDGDLLYTDCPQADNRIGFLHLDPTGVDRQESIFVSLPPTYSGKTLTIAQSTVSETQLPQLQIMACPVKMLTMAGYQRNTIAQAMRTAYPAALFAALAAGLLILFVIQAVRRQWNVSLVFLALFFLALMATVLVSAPFQIRYLPYIGLDYLGISELLAVTAMLLFLGARSKRPFRLPIMTAAAVQGTVLLFCSLIDLGWLAVDDPNGLLMFLPREISVLAMAAALVLAVMEWRRGSPFFRLFCKTMLLLAGGYVVFTLLSPLYLPGYLQKVAGLLYGAVVDLIPNFPLLFFRGLLIIPALVATLFDIFQREVQKTTELSVLTLKNELAEESLRNMQENAGSLRQWRHDFLHHLTMLEELHRSGDWERFDGYLSHLTKEMKAIPPLQYTQHPVVNAILSTELSRAQKAGVEVEVQVGLPDRISIADSDLCSLLMNMLDNAREACERMSPGLRRWIRVKLYIRGNYLCVAVENSTNGQTKQNPDTHSYETSKEDKTSHGYGLKSMEAVARRYSSKLFIECTADTFSVSSALLLPSPCNQNTGEKTAAPL